MFLPQVIITAVTSSLLGGQLAQRYGTKRGLLAGLAAVLTSMLLLIISQFFTSSQTVAYGHACRCRPERSNEAPVTTWCSCGSYRCRPG